MGSASVALARGDRRGSDGRHAEQPARAAAHCALRRCAARGRAPRMGSAGRAPVGRLARTAVAGGGRFQSRIASTAPYQPAAERFPVEAHRGGRSLAADRRTRARRARCRRMVDRPRLGRGRRNLARMEQRRRRPRGVCSLGRYVLGQARCCGGDRPCTTSRLARAQRAKRGSATGSAGNARRVHRRIAAAAAAGRRADRCRSEYRPLPVGKRRCWNHMDRRGDHAARRSRAGALMGARARARRPKRNDRDCHR